jgi:hypothetical protein
MNRHAELATTLAGHFLELAKEQARVGDYYSQLADADAEGKPYAMLADHFQRLSRIHVAAGDAMTQCARAAGGDQLAPADDDSGTLKAAAGFAPGRFDQIIPDRVSGIAPDLPADARLRPVFRAGQRDFTKEDPAAGVPVQFRKLVAISDDE